MLFNSTEFIFAFLPLTLAGFFVFGAISRGWARVPDCLARPGHREELRAGGAHVLLRWPYSHDHA